MLEKMVVLLVISVVALSGCSKETPQKATGTAGTVATSAPDIQEPVRDGEALFKQYCASCHPNGGNVSDPKRALYGSILKSRHIATPEDIVRIMRNPKSRMIRLDPSTLSDKDARVIADYVLKTFK
jgi:cytochrome c6